MRAKLWDTETARKSLAEAFEVCDVVFASMEDMNTLYGITEPEKAAKHLRAMGRRNRGSQTRGEKAVMYPLTRRASPCPGTRSHQ